MEENERVVVRVRGEHEAAHLWRDRLDLSAHLDPVAVGQADVEDGDVGLEVADHLEPLHRGPGLADDLQVVFGLEQRAQAGPHQLVIVEDENSNRHLANTATGHPPFRTPQRDPDASAV